MKRRLKLLHRLIIESGKAWYHDNVPRLSASLAYYTIFSLVPLLLVTLTITSYLVDETAAQQELLLQVSALVGSAAADGVEQLIIQAKQPLASKLGTVFGSIGLCLGALGVFKELKNSLNLIWKTPDKPRKKMRWYLFIWKVVRTHLVSFAMVLTIGFLLLVSLIVTTILSVVLQNIQTHVVTTDVLFHLINGIVSLGLTTLLLTLLFKVVPDLPVPCSSAWIGGCTAAILFTLGKTLLAVYIGYSNILNIFGAAGSLVVIVLWINYSSQVIFFGAEVSKIHERMFLHKH